MVNFNGELVSNEYNLNINNRGFLLGDGVFETIKVVHNKVLYLEDHYFRLMSAMRIVRMEIPMNFTMEFLENQILSTSTANNLEAARVRITVYRNEGGIYLPKTNEISYVITASHLDSVYINADGDYEVDLYKDFYITRQLLSNVKTTNRMINITASIFAAENNLQNCLLINDSKNVVESINGNLFMRMGNEIYTPPLTEGCLNGVMRKQILNTSKITEYAFIEKIISPFDLQKADELFFTNVIIGVQSIAKYRKKDYTNEAAVLIRNYFNDLISSKVN